MTTLPSCVITAAAVRKRCSTLDHCLWFTYILQVSISGTKPKGRGKPIKRQNFIKSVLPLCAMHRSRFVTAIYSEVSVSRICCIEVQMLLNSSSISITRVLSRILSLKLYKEVLCPPRKIWEFKFSEIDFDAIGVLKSVHFLNKYLGRGGSPNYIN